MTPTAIFQAEQTSGAGFEDIIDGYFPLQTSIAQLLARRSLSHAVLLLSHAPIMHIEGLSPQAPVPLSIRQGRAGMIDQMVLYAQTDALTGQGIWRWLDGTPVGDAFDPQTRLAEPAFLQGIHTPARATNCPDRIERTKDEHI
jgi:hypothetical protein